MAKLIDFLVSHTLVLSLVHAGLSFVLVGVATAEGNVKPVPEYVKVKAPYNKALRARLKRDGWKELGGTLRGGGSCPKSDDRCTIYAEAQICNGPFCGMWWLHRDGTVLTIETEGEKPQEMTIFLEGETERWKK